MTIRRADAADIPLILQLLRATPNPPNENEDTIADIIERSPTYVDTSAPALCRMAKRTDEDFVDIPWWTWRGSGDMGAKLGPVFATALAAFVREHGRKSLPWGIGGQISGFGETDKAKRTDADTRADAIKNFMQQGLSTNSVLRVRALNGVDSFLQSTVGLMAERIGIVVP